jgi:succinoglycan biosynthesis transport protein ExoP
MTETPSAPSIDPGAILRIVARRKWLLIAPWTIATLAGVAAALLLKPIYFSNVTLLLEHPTQLSGPLGGMVGGGGGADQQAEIMREQVQSSLFLRTVITASGMMSDLETRAWALKSRRPDPGQTAEETIEAALIDHLRDAITIRRNRGDVFQIAVGDYTRERARRFAEAVSNQFVLSSKAAQLEAVRATQEFSVEQQQIYKHKLDESQARLDAARRASIANTISGAAVTPNNLVRARGLADQADLEIESQRQRVEDIRTQLTGKVRDNDAGLLTTAETSNLADQVVALERQLAAALLTDATGDQGAAIRSSLARKSSELDAAYQRGAAIALPALPADVRDLLVRLRMAQSDLVARQARRVYLADQVAQFERTAVASPDRDLALARLQQEVDNNQALYNSFLQQSAAAQISEAFENAKLSGRFSVLEPANLPRAPGKPNRPLLVVLAFLVGGLIGIGTVLVVEQHDQSMKNAEEVENLLGLPVLGAIPRVEDLERSSRRARPITTSAPGLPAARDGGLLHRLKVESPLGLEFRRIYLNLAKSRGRTLPRTLLITSATRGEGKTTTTACLAITLAREAHEKLLLVDFDLRSPALHRALGVPSSSWGLAQMLKQRSFDERFVRQTVLPGLDFLPAGKSERPASELIDSESVDWFVREASSRWPLVLIDSAPNLAVPDSLILGRAVEGVLYVIKAGSTVRKAAEYGVKVQREARDNVLGVLLNDAGEILPQYYGYRSNTYGYTTEVAGGES